ncbi:MAG: TetR/AcrR family transcriptional regulator [Thermoleophilaceae bacterium]|nr:TetR/AcrR family transcriptional regulator [Thermoleophilaceae bacterium]
MPRTSDRQTRRKNETRAKLIAAARVLLARQGAEATRIQEITEEADVGFGSFYNHFSSKEEIVEAVLSETLVSQAAAVAAVEKEIDDPAEVISAAHRSFVLRARSDPDWGWLLLRLDASHDLVTNALGPFARRDLKAATKAGRLNVPDLGVALSAQGGAMIAVMRSVVDGTAPEDADIFHAEGVLRMLGLPADEAAEVARRPLPAAVTEQP